MKYTILHYFLIVVFVLINPVLKNDNLREVVGNFKVKTKTNPMF